jgi:hypothetical protein
MIISDGWWRLRNGSDIRIERVKDIYLEGRNEDNILFRWNKRGICFRGLHTQNVIDLDDFDIVENMIREGQWKVRNGEIIDLCLYEDKGKNGGIQLYDIDGIGICETYCVVSNEYMHYDRNGKCQIQINKERKIVERCNSDDLEAWDLMERFEEVKVVVKRNSNPIFMLDVCTE